MNRTISTLTMAAAFIAGAANVAIAQETVKLTSVVPAQGVTEWVGTHTMTFPSEPSRNEACTEQATLSQDGQVIAAIETYQSASLQQKVEGLTDMQMTFVFSTKRITKPGVYTINVPEGFLTFEEGTKVNAEINLEYVIASGDEAIVIPTPGYYPDGAPYRVEITFPGVTSIEDMHQPYDSDTGLGGIRYETPANMYQTYSVEGNKVILTPGSKEFMTAGEYRVIISAGALTFHYADGTSKLSTLLYWNYLKPVFPMPEVNFLSDPEHIFELPNKVVLTLPEGFTWGQVMRPAAVWYDNGKGEYDKDKGAMRAYVVDTSDLPRGKQDCNLYDGQASPYMTDKTTNLIFRWDKACVSAKGPVYDPDLHNTDYYNPGGTRQPGDVIEVFNDVAYMYRFTLRPHPGTMNFPFEANAEVGPLDEFPIYFPGADFVEVNKACAEQPCIKNFAGNKVQEGYTVTLSTPEYPVAQMDGEDTTVPYVMVNVNPPFVPSKKVRYQIYIPKGAITINNMVESPETKHIVYVDPAMISTEVEAIPEVAPKAVTVVDLSGKTLVKDGTPSDLMSLPAGIYVINGQTTILR